MSGTSAAPVLQVNGLDVVFSTRNGPLTAVSDVDLTVHAGRTVALVGESGSGKSTIARALLGLLPDARGFMSIDGIPTAMQRSGRSAHHKRALQMVFQDPASSINPRRTMRDVVAEPLVIARVPAPEREAEVSRLMVEVGLDPELYGARTLDQISGGQAQRVAIARALAAGPQVLLADEPVSGLDVSAQATVLSTLARVTGEHSVAMLVISHDLPVVRMIADDMVVLYLGRICETGPTESLLERPAHPYTATLMAAVPGADPAQAGLEALDVEPPSPLDPPPGCAFAARCPLATEQCRDVRPEPVALLDGRTVACHHPLVENELGTAASPLGGATSRRGSGWRRSLP